MKRWDITTDLDEIPRTIETFTIKTGETQIPKRI